MANVLVTIRTVDDQGTPAPIDDVLVRVYNNLDVFITEGLTGNVIPGSGEVEFTLDGTAEGVPYRIRLHKNGVSFLPAPTFDISVLDPPGEADNTFQYSGHIGATAKIVTLVVKDDESNPIENFRIRIYDNVDIFLTSVISDAEGEVSLALEGSPDPGKAHIIRLLKTGWVVNDGPTQQIQVLDPLISPATNVFDFVAAQPEIPLSTDDNMCLLSGYCVDAANQPLNRVRIRCIPLYQNPDLRTSGFPGVGTPTIIGRNQILREAIFETDEDGYVEVLLPRGSTHEVHIHGYELPGFPTTAPIYIPDAASAKLENILFPFITEVDFDITNVTLTVGDTQVVVPAILNSDTRDLSGTINLLEYSSLDENVATVSTDSSSLVITAIGVGSTTLNVVRSPDTWVNRVPPIPDLVSTTVSIEVS